MHFETLAPCLNTAEAAASSGHPLTHEDLRGDCRDLHKEVEDVLHYQRFLRQVWGKEGVSASSILVASHNLVSLAGAMAWQPEGRAHLYCLPEVLEAYARHAHFDLSVAPSADGKQAFLAFAAVARSFGSASAGVPGLAPRARAPECRSTTVSASSRSST